MGQAEKEIQQEIFRNLTGDQRRFRANAGMAWTGKYTRLKNGDVLLKNPRPFHGMPEGFPDVIGWDTVEITPDMVGQKIAVFVGEEIKAGRDRLKPAQKRFGELLHRMGGIWRVVKG